MVRKHKKFTTKTTGRMIIILILLCSIIATLVYTLLINLEQINDLENEFAKLEQKQEELEEDEEAYNADIKRLSEDEYIARYAREKYFYYKDGERVLKFDD